MNHNLHVEPPPIKVPPVGTRKHEDALLDEAVAESMIASDPISPAAQALMDPVGVSPTTRPRQQYRPKASTLWLVGIVTTIAYLALMRGRRSDRP